LFSFIAAERANYPVAVMCRALAVKRSSFYAWERRPPSERALEDVWLTEKIKQIHQANRGVYGAPRIHAELRLAHGIRVSRKRVERLMRTAAISGLAPRKRGRTTIRVRGVRVADDLVERRFRPPAPNVLWLADITYLRTWEGWLYLAAVQDAYSRAIVGWSMAEHMRAQLVVDALAMALARRRPERGLIHHSDQAASTSASASARPPATPASRSRWAREAMPMTTPSPRASSRRSRGTRPPPLMADQARARSAVFEYIEAFYNRERRHSTLSMLSPAEYERTQDNAITIKMNDQTT
jgi:putative transposase